MIATPDERLRRERESRGLSQSELARRAGISRQALGAIESGAYAPSVAVALALGRELGATVESLFGAAGFERIEAVVSGGARPPAHGARVALARVGGHVVAVPQAPAAFALAPAGGIVERMERGRTSVEAFRSAAEIDSTLLVAGCDPAVALLAAWLMRKRPGVSVVALASSSSAALDTVACGGAHAAGVHLRDAKTGEYNLGPARRALGRRRTALVNFARWELGLAAAPRNPFNVRGFADLARPRLRLINREPGAGARAALDEALRALRLDARKLSGYEREARGHLEVAAEIASGRADAGVTIRVAAEAYGLTFIPIREERYDLAIPEREQDSPAVRAMLDALNSAPFAREVRELCAYDTRDMGKVVARLG
jgi:molybdopterin molybdotransferase/putative molybdopterin biosynthesis protein